ncbi:hypothetical protein JW826_02740 [Candidatus Woesearchaeota archaeon]|nr:hypothetical protein [Candidatus Woesearchaeota archaeon]
MIEPDKWFYFAGGRNAKSLRELVEALSAISDEEFVFHVNSAKNDFANWVEGVFSQKGLADELRHVMERKDTVAIIERFISNQAQGQTPHLQELGKAHGSPAVSPVAGEEPKLGAPGAASAVKSVVKDEPKETVKEAVKEIAAPPVEKEIPAQSKEALIPPPKEEMRIAAPRPEQLLAPPPPHASPSAKEPVRQRPDAAEPVASVAPAAQKPVVKPAPVKKQAPDQVDTEREHELDDNELEALAEDMRFEMKLEGRQIEERRKIEARYEPHHTKFLIKEFIYGFILGLIFGLIMLGSLMNVNICY